MKNINLIFSLSILLNTSLISQTVHPKLILEEKGKKNAYPRLSKDNKQILYQTNRNGKWQLEILNLKTNKSLLLLKDTFNNNFPEWSSDNKQIAFVSDRDGNEEIYIMQTNGTGIKRLTNNKSRDIHPYFSPDGKYILFNSNRGNGSLDIYRITLADEKLERLTNTPENESCARYSPDMKQMIFLKNDEKTDDVFCYDFNTNSTNNITNTPSTEDGWPIYNYDGKWIYFSSMENGLYCIYKIKPNGTGKQMVTRPSEKEEDARVFVSQDEKTIIYNKETKTTISIYSATL